MGEKQVDAVVLSVGADLPYFTGYEAMPSERLTAFVVRADAEPLLVVPALEVPRIPDGPYEIRSWDETEDPVGIAASTIDPSRVAVGDHMWSIFLTRLQKEWIHADWLPASEVIQDLRIIKDAGEIDLLRRAAQALDRAMARIPSEVVFAGRSERQIAGQLQEMTVEEGHDQAEFAIVGSGPNSASPHHEPGARIVTEGDMVVCDFGGRWGGYYSDSTRTFVVGEPTAEQTEVHSVVLAANEAGRQAIRPGVLCEEIDSAARTVIADAGYADYFIHRTGHGIGLEIHEHPYMVLGNDQALEPGMAFSIEPGVYLPHNFGVRIEDIVVCEKEGVNSLNESSRTLNSVA